MHPDKKRSIFTLNDLDQSLLGLRGLASWPMDDAVGLLEQAEHMRAGIFGSDLAASRPGAERIQDHKALMDREAALRNIISIIEPHLPRVSDGAEGFLFPGQSS